MMDAMHVFHPAPGSAGVIVRCLMAPMKTREDLQLKCKKAGLFLQ